MKTTGRIRCPVVLVFSSVNSDFHLKLGIRKIIPKSFIKRLCERVLDLEMVVICLDCASFLYKSDFLLCHAVILTFLFPVMSVPEP